MKTGAGAGYKTWAPVDDTVSDTVSDTVGLTVTHGTAQMKWPSASVSRRSRRH